MNPRRWKLGMLMSCITLSWSTVAWGDDEKTLEPAREAPAAEETPASGAKEIFKQFRTCVKGADVDREVRKKCLKSLFGAVAGLKKRLHRPLSKLSGMREEMKACAKKEGRSERRQCMLDVTKKMRAKLKERKDPTPADPGAGTEGGAKSDAPAAKEGEAKGDAPAAKESEAKPDAPPAKEGEGKGDTPPAEPPPAGGAEGK